ncbi:mitochondrial import inner membrane translocase subunit TIM50-like [Arachis duranensis]|uniref:Mitochondrial import inner membrane translocase subunit TIM50 n=1 Tax=Arachis duranensis TaxID=130453 RepID=A0A6P4DZ10_ARADU|nr:mitochondrial import inner membrane translocase subunit TIM50-like [Arachis duranensis]
MLSRMRVLRSKRVGEFLLSFRRHRFLCTNLNPPAAASSLRIGSFLKYAAVSALTGSTAFTAYVSYAYSLDEIEEKTKSIRESAKYTTASGAGDNGCTTLGKFQHKLYSTAISVPTKAIELYLEKRTLIEGIIRSYTEPWKDKLLPDLSPDEGKHVYTLVLDLDETLIYYELVNGCWEAVKRPGVVDFLEHLSRLYEIVVYTDEENQGHVEAVINKLHPTKRCIIYSLSRVATKYQDGKHFRDLSKLNRDPAKVIYLSGHALENCLQPENCVPMKPCKGFDKDDTTLLDFIPFLKCVARQRPTDIRPILQSYRGCDIPTEFIKRNKRSKEDKSYWRKLTQMIGV